MMLKINKDTNLIWHVRIIGIIVLAVMFWLMYLALENQNREWYNHQVRFKAACIDAHAIPKVDPNTNLLTCVKVQPDKDAGTFVKITVP